MTPQMKSFLPRWRTPIHQTLLCLLPSYPNHQTRTPPFQLSNTASFGGSAPQTLCVNGFIYGYPVTVLIDTGSSHNILQTRLAHFLQLLVSPFSPFSVMVGNGDQLKCSGLCSDVSFNDAEAQFPSTLILVTYTRCRCGVGYGVA